MRSSMSWSDVEVAGVELVGGTDLGRGRGRQVEHGASGGGGTGSVSAKKFTN